jgi:diacylglycerol kinase (ATP)
MLPTYNPQLPACWPSRNCILLCNPFARRVTRATIGRAASAIGLEGRAIREIGGDGTARYLTEQAVQDRVPVLIAAGGDGTLHEVIQVLAGSDTTLGVLPLGTSNDLAKRIGIPPGLAGLKAALNRPRSASLDLLRIGDVYIATVGGLGLPAHVADICNRLRARRVAGPALSRLGGGLYSVVAGARILQSGAEMHVYTVQSNDAPALEVRASAILVGLCERFGGGLRLTPNGAVRPGTFAALFVTAQTRGTILRTLALIKLGRSTAGLARAQLGLTRLSVRTSDLVAAFGDGEWLGLRYRSVIELEPRALKVLLPSSRANIGGLPQLLRRAV